jgi:cytochrome c
MSKTSHHGWLGLALTAGAVIACSSGTEIVGFIPSMVGSATGGSATGGTASSFAGSVAMSSGGSGGDVSTAGGQMGTAAAAGSTSVAGTGGSAVTAGGSGGASSGGSGGSAGAANTGPINVLVFNYTAGYGHQSRETAIPLLQTAAAANNINLDLKYAILKGKDGNYLPEGTSDVSANIPVDLSAFTPGGLDKYDVVFFLNTTGHVFQGGDEAVHEQALQDYMEQHHGSFVGTHSATDTYDENWQWYQDFIGSIYSGHSGVVPGSARWKDGVSHVILTAGQVPNPWSRTEEWYNFRRDVSSLPGFTVLLLATESGGTERETAWVHEIAGGGRVFYTAFGHYVATFQEPAFMTFLMTGIKWAAHRL